MSLAIHPNHLRRYRDIAWLLWKHGRADWVSSAGLDRAVGTDDSKSEGQGPECLTADLESLGPSFVKIGQLLASRADLMPLPYLQALSRLHDHVNPVEFEDIETVMSEELEARPSRIFAEFDPRPLASASLAQVHAAKLRDGREVVVKVQRPNVAGQMQVDFEAFAALARLADETSYGRKYRVRELVAEFRRAIEDELDYRLELNNLERLRENLAEFKLLVVPRPYAEFSSRRVLTMDRIAGTNISAVSPVIFTEVDGAAMAEELFAAYLKQVLIDGFFHADPHPGNVLLTRDHEIGLIDLGMVGRIDEELQTHLLTLLIAVSEGRAGEAGEAALRAAATNTEFDRDEFLLRVSDLVMRHKRSTIADINVGRLVLQIQQVAGDTGVRLPRALTLVGKTLMNLDSIARTLAPGFDPNASIRRHTIELLRRRSRQRLSPRNLLRSALETTELAAQLPRRLNEVLKQLAGSGIRIDADVFDEQTFVQGFQRVANRITAGLVMAAMIIGAALLMRVETHFTLFGYPGLAIIFFLTAAGGGVALLYQIHVSDRRENDRRR